MHRKPLVNETILTKIRIYNISAVDLWFTFYPREVVKHSLEALTY